MLTRAIANPLAAQCHSRTGAVGSARLGISALEAPDYGPEVTAGQLLVCLVMTSSGSIALRASPWLRRAPFGGGIVHVEPMSDDLIGVVGAAFESGEQLVLANLAFQHRIDAGVVSRQRAGYCLGLVAALRSSTVSTGFGSMRRRCTSNAKHSSATSLGR